MEPKTQEADWESCRLTIPANLHVNSNKVLLLFKRKKDVPIKFIWKNKHNDRVKKVWRKHNEQRRSLKY